MCLGVMAPMKFYLIPQFYRPETFSFTYHCRSGDYSGHGRADIICYADVPGFNRRLWTLGVSNGAGWDFFEFGDREAGTQDRGEMPLPLRAGSDGTKWIGACKSADFNGDGLDDIACPKDGDKSIGRSDLHHATSGMWRSGRCPLRFAHSATTAS